MPRDQNGASCGSHSLLIVEDDPIQLCEVARRFEEIGFAVTTAQSAEDAIFLVQTREFNFILTDNILPGMTGLNSIAELGRYSQAPVVLMSSGCDTELQRDAFLLGARLCVKKPINAVQLHEEYHAFCSRSDPSRCLRSA